MARVGEINNVVADIASGANEQSAALGGVNAAINQMDQATQQNAAMVEQSTAASHSLSQETVQLSGLIGQFQVGRATGEDSMRRELQKVAPHAFRQPAKPAAATGARAEARIVVSNRPEARKPARPARAAAEAMVVNGSAAGGDSGGWEEF